jgi:G3E family GTPase
MSTAIDSGITQVSPIYVIGGFLGSGKTTLLKRLLAHELDRGTKPSVLMNEFGAIDIDSKILDGDPRCCDIEYRRIMNGCACCDVSAELDGKIEGLVQSRPGSPIFIETTGLAATEQVVARVDAMVARTPTVVLASTIIVVDALRHEQMKGRWTGEKSYIESADVIVLNKIDETDEAAVSRLAARLKKRNTRATILPAAFAKVDVPQLLAAREPRRMKVRRHTETTDSTRGYLSVSVELKAPLELDALKSLLSRYNRSIVRAKGIIRIAREPGPWEVQWVPGQLTAEPYTGARRIKSQFVMIGRGVQWSKFVAGLEKCVVSTESNRKRQNS